jgi:tetratricopeptide (TPR) repeat protein
MAANNCAPKDVEAVIKYGNIGKTSKSEGVKGLSCVAEVYKETGDSIKWLEVIKEGAMLFPKEQYFVANLMDSYIQKGMIDEGLIEVDNLLAANETPFLLHVKSVLLNEKRDYEGAMAVADEIIAMGGEFQAEAYAMKGNCYYNPAQLLLLENNELSLEDPKYNANLAKIKDAYAKAMPFYEQAQKLAPQNTALWGNPLLRIYYDLNKATEYDILSKELGY